MPSIQSELKTAETHMLSVIQETSSWKIPLVELTHDNVAKVEAMIQNDSAYLKSSSKDAGPDSQKGYKGSAAYWMTQLKAILIENEKVSVEGAPKETSRLEEIIRYAVEAVDRENSTHLNADRCGRDEITKRIIDLVTEDKEKFLKSLLEPDETKLSLIEEIKRETHPTGVDKKDKPIPPRTNLSFASKFCHYACFYLFEGKAEQDNYSIYDKVLREAMPKYIMYYGIKKSNDGGDFDLDDYADYRKAVDRIIKASGNQISRNGFDHLLWYYFKGRL
ncbi:MAG: hypothetical protein MJ202_01600 [Lentisphaeria bacterium]|nr:hypothetical protein [Lentisphaeria bacterium]